MRGHREQRPTKGSEKLKACRKAAKLSQLALAKELRSHQGTISRWENGTEVPTGSYLDALIARFPAIRREDFYEKADKARLRSSSRARGGPNARASRTSRAGAA